MFRRFHSHQDSDSGQALVELALVLPILLVLILGLVDLATAYERWNEQTSYANSVARYLAVGKDVATAKSSAGTVPGGACVQVSLPNGTYAQGDPIKVDVKSTYNYLGFFANFTKVATAPVNGSATTRIEVAPAGNPVTAVCP